MGNPVLAQGTTGAALFAVSHDDPLLSQKDHSPYNSSAGCVCVCVCGLREGSEMSCVNITTTFLLHIYFSHVTDKT